MAQGGSSTAATPALASSKIVSRLRKSSRAPAEEELALFRDEQVSDIPALDSLRNRSARFSELQKVLAQANISMRVGNFLGISAVVGVVPVIIAYTLSKRAEVVWIALLAGFILPYSYACIQRSKRLERLEREARAQGTKS